MSNKERIISILKKILLVVVVLLIIWVIRNFKSLTGNYFKHAKEEKELELQVNEYYSNYVNVDMMETKIKNHVDTFDLDKANENAETDFSKVLEEETEIFKEKCSFNAYRWSNDFTIDKVYSFCNYKGVITLDESELDGLRGYDIFVGPYSSSATPEKCSYKKKDGVITVDYEIIQPRGVYIIIIGKKTPIANGFKSFAENVADTVKASASGIVAYPDLRNGNFLVSNYFLKRTFNIKPLMIMVSSGDEKTDAKIRKLCFDSASYFVDSELNGIWHMEMTEDDVKVVSPKVFKYYYKKYRLLYPNSEATPYRDGYYSPDYPNPKYDWLYWMGYYTYTDLLENIADMAEKERQREAAEIFGREDIFRFTNFCSNISYGGNCAGIAYYTMKLSNTAVVDSSGSFDTNSWPEYNKNSYGSANGEVSWDILKDEENHDLLNRHINNYNTSFKSDHTANYTITYPDGTTESKELTINNLKPYEEEFVKMIGYYWFEYNRRSNELDDVREYGEYWDYAMIEELIQALDNNNILTIAFGSKKRDENGEITNTGHAVNVYSYVAYDNGDVDLYLYDSNYPNAYVLTRSWADLWETSKRHEVMNPFPHNARFCIMHVQKKIVNGQEVFTYDYDAYGNGAWIATNNPSLIGESDCYHYIEIADENFDFYNTRYNTIKE